MDDKLLQASIWLRNLPPSRLVRDESGEGVISAAIAVLIMAALGALMWVGFQEIWSNASSQTDSQITKIGS